MGSISDYGIDKVEISGVVEFGNTVFGSVPLERRHQESVKADWWVG